MSELSTTDWRKCSSCKKPIPYGALYWVCNVSTCNRKRTGLIFCEVSCWDAHLPMMNHREAWAEERTAPTRDEWERAALGEDEKPRLPRQPAEPKAPAEVASSPASPPRVIVRRKSQPDT